MMRRVLDRQFGKGRSAGLGVLIAAGGLAATAFAGCSSESASTSGFPSGAGGATGAARLAAPTALLWRGLRTPPRPRPEVSSSSGGGETFGRGR